MLPAKSSGRVDFAALPVLPLLLAVPLAVCLGGRAEAHVKWFAAYNVAAAPTALPEVFSGSFVIIAALSALLILMVYLCDRTIEAVIPADIVENLFAAAKPLSGDILRISLGAFFLCLWTIGGIILTPELKTSSEAISWFQLLFALTTLSWRTVWIAGLGIFVLYGIAIADYGLFHLMDYPLFLGIAAYLIIRSLKIERLRPYALSILYVAMAQTLLWASVEKWAFGAWTMPLLAQHERITLGIDHRIYLILAGFVEFVASFLLLYGRTSQRLVAFTLLVIFLAAVIDFGKIDAVGHSMIIATLAVTIINGNTIINRVLQNHIPSFMIGGSEAVVTYLGYLLLFFTMYYGLHGLIYGSLG
ncbi:hypothetical protein DWF00_18055 [Bosea caraganae]|uniref:Uncharacterized protein n=1 Tax=Bosea caraganae TaxID=2763117 RepID=A0A370L7R6_9HYPH|nr:hypothetical protein [Bosea caraganae]RDJ25103.1 hypothetical protein DWF00_18055 [Bosea caraganae]RDJ26213.1 hypothetical protein DWE98_10275 [Bosea caraganae]